MRCPLATRPNHPKPQMDPKFLRNQRYAKKHNAGKKDE